jgi:hypothetical protein
MKAKIKSYQINCEDIRLVLDIPDYNGETLKKIRKIAYKDNGVINLELSDENVQITFDKGLSFPILHDKICKLENEIANIPIKFSCMDLNGNVSTITLKEMAEFFIKMKSI